MSSITPIPNLQAQLSSLPRTEARAVIAQHIAKTKLQLCDALQRFSAVLNNSTIHLTTTYLTTTLSHSLNTVSHLQSLTQLHNDYSAIGALPAEVLGLILVEAVQNSPQPFTTIRKRKHIALASVCRTWRAVALANPFYWANLPISLSPHFGELVQRTRQVPLRVRVGTDNMKDDGEKVAQALQVLMQPARLREFHVVRKEPDVLDSFLQLYPTEPTPLMRSLCIKGLKPEGYFAPDHIFAHEMPSLQRFLVIGVQIAWYMFAPASGRRFYSNLTHLYLDTANAPPVELFLQMINTSPCLKQLGFFFVTPKDLPTFNPDVHRAVRLNYLEKYTLSDELAQVTNLRQFIAHPPTAQLQLLARGRFGETGQLASQGALAAFFDAWGLSTAARPANSPPPRPFQLTLGGYDGHVADMHWCIGPLGTGNKAGKVTFNCCKSNAPFVRGSLKAPDHLRRLVIRTSMEGCTTDENWTSFFIGHQEIDTIEFHGSLCTAVFSALSPRLEDIEMGHLPKLRHISLDRVDLDAYAYGCIMPMLFARRTRGATLPSFKVKKCGGFNDSMLQQLEDITGPDTIDWDGELEMTTDA